MSPEIKDGLEFSLLFAVGFDVISNYMVRGEDQLCELILKRMTERNV